jgi:transcriptional regulator with XRE-family HTH domain
MVTTEGTLLKREDRDVTSLDRQLRRADPPPGPGGPRASETPDWQQWMRDFGLQIRRTREFLGLSQEQVARLAGVSQGAVSRLESARGLATPMLIVLKVQLAIVHHLRKLDPAILDPELRRALEMQEALARPFGNPSAGGASRVANDADLEELVRLYQATPERQRKALLSIVKAAAAGLKPPGS